MTGQMQVDRSAMRSVLQQVGEEALRASVEWHGQLSRPLQGSPITLISEGAMLAEVSAKALRDLGTLIPDASSQEVAVVVWHLMAFVEEVHLGWVSQLTRPQRLHTLCDNDRGSEVKSWLTQSANRCLHQMAEELAHSGLILGRTAHGAAREAV